MQIGSRAYSLPAFSAVTWVVADILAGENYSHPIVYILEHIDQIWFLYYRNLSVVGIAQRLK